MTVIVPFDLGDKVYVVDVNNKEIFVSDIRSISTSTYKGMTGQECLQVQYKSTTKETSFVTGAMVEGLYEPFKEKRQAIEYLNILYEEL